VDIALAVEVDAVLPIEEAIGPISERLLSPNCFHGNCSHIESANDVLDVEVGFAVEEEERTIGFVEDNPI